jgi:phage-related protein
MAKLADILVSLTLETKDFNKQLKTVSRNIESLSNSVGKATTKMKSTVQGSTSAMASGMESVNNTMERMESVIQATAGRATSSFQRMGRSSNAMASQLGTDMQSHYKIMKQAQREYENFSMVGRHVSQEIKDEFSALPSHLQRYVQKLREAGKSTAGFATLNEQYSARIIESMGRANDYLQNKTTQSTRLMQSFANDTNLAPLTNQFLRLGNRLEENAKKGTLLNLALQRIGPNASLKDLNDQMNFLSQGLGRVRGAFLVFAIAGGLATYGMINLAAAVDDRVMPAFDRMKSHLIDAMEPFITSFATAMVAVMNFVTKIADMTNKFSEANPLIFTMINWIILLTMVFGTLLAPLALTGIAAEGVAAAFTALWAVIAPFVLGFLAVIGIAVACAAAFVVLWVSIQQLWANSEAFRTAFINIWNSIKTAVMDGFVTPVVAAWNNLKLAFSNLIATVTGGSGTMGSLWTWLGGIIATVATTIWSVVFPVLQTAFQVLGTVVSAVINGIVTAVNWLSQAWQDHKAQILPVMQQIGQVVQTAIGAITQFIKDKLPQIKQIVSDTIDAVKTAFNFFMTNIWPTVQKAITLIWNIFQKVMPFILSLVVDTWNSIKAAITSALNIVQNVIQLFSNVLKGNWKGAWDNVKNIVKNAVTLIWNLIKLGFLGKIMKVFTLFKGKAVTAITNAFSKMKTGISNKVSSIKSTVTSKFNQIKTAILKPIESAKTKVLGIIDKIKSAFARMKIKIPKPKVPSIEIGSKEAFGGKVKVPTFKLKWNAKGNIFTQATAVGNGQGVGEAGAEGVIPLQRKRYMRPFSDAVAEQMMKNGGLSSQGSGNNQYTIQFNEPVYIREEADITKIVKEMERKQRTQQRAKGTFSYKK